MAKCLFDKMSDGVFENPKIKANAHLDSLAVSSPIFSRVIRFIRAAIVFQVD